MPKSDTVRIRHMLDAAKEAVAFTEGKTRGDLDSDRKLNLSLVRLIEVVGEAANQVSAETQARCAQVPWPDIIGMRHRLVHGYDEVDLDIVWQVVTLDLPSLVVALEEILQAEDKG
ncbi:MAG: DUF86 domain-containing protein [Chloroflexi bacterium]|nr:DUF86 domain-containing protein [Chloroflexota bacterium]